MNEHSIREIARVSWEVDAAYKKVALGHGIPEWDAATDEAQDSHLETVRFVIDKLSTGDTNISCAVSQKVMIACIKALVTSERLL